jgi:AcrR family transcriptional regulator
MVRELSTDKRERFLNAALKLFATNGMQATSTAEIAREAGAAAGTLFLYFPTKQNLINELVLEISKQQSAAINNLLNPSQTAREMLFVIWDGSIRWFLEHMDAYNYTQQIRDTNVLTTETVEKTAVLFRYYYDAIQKGLEEGSIKPLHIDLIGGFLYQDITAVMNFFHLQSDPDKATQFIQQGFDLFWDGISTNHSVKD